MSAGRRCRHFRPDVSRGQLDVEAVIDLLAVRQRDIVEARPEAQALGITRLQLDHQLTGAIGELGRLVEALLGGAVELLEVGQLAFRGGRLLSR